MPLLQDAALDKELEISQKDMQWIYDRYEDLKRQYPGEFVAVYREELLGHGADIAQLVRELKQSHKDRASDIAIKFIYKESPNSALTL
ncbi:MAG: hypothetical protein A2Z21_01185 [Candidatus Fraserbacteria bacterium RBG_16_55_9]|uniref:DUF5678 domain-containing protein n=1 Tax=Fraserbacteria sp. (strain RBG_16_55_9) TaxID=1817864 RepID=A0A1F5UQ59_FRAXR|nr:MAG: hypothetical protein A2Z21_01185 [Candidatus Fraserbacteria bacterium RBG_16_55_9]